MGSGPCSPRFMDLGNDSYISSVLQCVRMPPQLRSSWCWNSPLRYLLGIAAIKCEQRRLTSVRADSRSPNCGSPPYIHCETRPVRRITVGKKAVPWALERASAVPPTRVQTALSCHWRCQSLKTASRMIARMTALPPFIFVETTHLAAAHGCVASFCGAVVCPSCSSSPCITHTCFNSIAATRIDASLTLAALSKSTLYSAVSLVEAEVRCSPQRFYITTMH